MTKIETDEASQQNKAAGRWLFNQGCEFCFGVVAVDALPPADHIEICFAGRSNVGKSSLINALTNRKALARTSNTPGRTQELNFFLLAPAKDVLPKDVPPKDAPHEGAPYKGAMWLVDLPGYGYARENKNKIAAWNKLLRAYLKGRANLRRALVLIDSRHGLKANDLEMLDTLDEAALSYQIVLTKIDKLKQDALAQMLANTQQAINKRVAAHPVVLVTSAEKNIGLDDLRGEIASLADLPKLGYKAGL